MVIGPPEGGSRDGAVMAEREEPVSSVPGMGGAETSAGRAAPVAVEETCETRREATVVEEEAMEGGDPEGSGWGEEALPPVPGAGDSEPEKSVQDPKLDEGEDGDDECSSSSDYGSHDKPGTALQRVEPEGNTRLPDIFQTNNLLFYERFKAYQDYMLVDAVQTLERGLAVVLEWTRANRLKLKPGVQAPLANGAVHECAPPPTGPRTHMSCPPVTALQPCEHAVHVVDVEYSTLKAVVRLCEPFLCETQEGTFTPERMQELLELKEHRLPLQELWVVFEESGEFDQTALAVEHVRFFYKHIWRSWDEEDDDDFDYFVRCVEPRLRLYYDIAEDRVPSTLVAEYYSRLAQCEEQYRAFVDVRNRLSGGDSDSEAENVCVVEGMKLYERIEHLKQKLKLIENPLLRYVFGYQKHAGLRAKGARSSGNTITHVVSSTMMSSLLECLVRDKLSPEPPHEEMQIQFHHDLQSAMTACYEGDTIIICPGHYTVEGSLYIADSVSLEGYGLPDDVVIEERGKADAFVECTGADVKISSLKLIQHDATEGILSIHRGKTSLENCVLQCETTGVAVRTSAEFSMKNSDMYGAKGAGVEVYPGGTCTLIGNGIHHCKEGILIKDFLDEHYETPKITMVNNVIHNNEGYGVVLVKPTVCLDRNENAQENSEGPVKDTPLAGDASNTGCENLPRQTSGELDSWGEKPTEENSEIAHELSAISLKKSQQHKKRLSHLGITEADDDLMSQAMFVSIVGNQFKRNGKGSFGTFLY
nr:SHC SH2 domain-binding protein 1 [Pogona vitticeps]